MNTKALIIAASAAALFTAGCSHMHHQKPVDKFGKPVGHSWHHPKKNSCGAG